MVVMAVKVTRDWPPGWFMWFAPLVVFPAALVGGISEYWRVGSNCQRLLMLRYLAVYLPFIGFPIAAIVYCGWVWQLAIAVLMLPFQLGLPFWYARRMKLLRQAEARGQA